ncbi:unnamed protein product [Meloidogyne enterolobii]|uniref:Uncharacterized protein n=1 Tax=Meloidogyne enterolobii TaxID=390850 RepID=A0ACB0XRR7_MELEN
MIWSEMTKYYWYGDTEMQIQYVELNDLTEKQIAQNISVIFLLKNISFNQPDPF